MTEAKMPKVFIGSSLEGIEIARAIQLELQHETHSTLWNQGVFGLSGGTLESLVAATNRFDFAILVVTPDDVMTKRQVTTNTPRDNVLFELGLFIGALGRDRTFIVRPTTQMDMPSDLAGITPATYAPEHDLPASVGPACTQIRLAIKVAAGNAPSRNPVLSQSSPHAKTEIFSPPLSSDAQRIFESHGKFWEIHLFSQIVSDEFRALSGRREDLTIGLVDGPFLKMDDGDAVAWMADQFKIIQRIPKNLRSLFETAFPSAMGPPGVPADPQSLVRIARRIAREYEQTIEWGIQWRRLHVADEFSRLIDLGPQAAISMASSFIEWQDLVRETVRSCMANEVPKGSVINMTFKLELPDGFVEKMQGELDDIGTRIVAKMRENM